jgi:hypothetical protein
MRAGLAVLASLALGAAAGALASSGRPQPDDGGHPQPSPPTDLWPAEAPHFLYSGGFSLADAGWAAVDQPNDGGAPRVIYTGRRGPGSGP